jgi:hypothetical protein
MLGIVETRLVFRFLLAAALVATVAVRPGGAAIDPSASDDVLRQWYRLSLALIRHTPTYSPPVASRALAYLGIAAYEAVASGSPDLGPLAGQLNGLEPLPVRNQDLVYDDAVVLHAALASMVRSLFANTGPSGQQAMSRLVQSLGDRVATGQAADVVARSTAFGEALAARIIAWSRSDGGAVIENLGFPLTYALQPGSAHWVPTNATSRLQQLPLLPEWGKNRPFAMPRTGVCPLPPPPQYSENKASEFYKQALEVRDVVEGLDTERRAIAGFWSDDPMLSPTPAGHWISILLQIADRERLSLERSVDALARLSIAMADSFIGCWEAKYRYDLLRPVTYIHRHIDPKWQPLLLTPPFPEYPSGHSVQSGAAATVLAQIFGDAFPFTDNTRERDGIMPRHFTGFWAAAREAGLSRLYGGIHFRAAIERGLEQGRCIGAYANALKTWR